MRTATRCGDFLSIIVEDRCLVQCVAVDARTKYTVRTLRIYDERDEIKTAIVESQVAFFYNKRLFFSSLCTDTSCLQSLDEINNLLDSGDTAGLFLRDFTVEFLLNSHDHFNSIKRIGTKVINETGLWLDVSGIHPELLDDDFRDLVGLLGEEGAGHSGASHGARGEGRGADNQKSEDSVLEHLE